MTENEILGKYEELNNVGKRNMLSRNKHPCLSTRKNINGEIHLSQRILLIPIVELRALLFYVFFHNLDIL